MITKNDPDKKHRSCGACMILNQKKHVQCRFGFISQLKKEQN